MNEVGVEADVTVPPSRLQYFRSNLSSIVLSIIPASSQFLNRFKKGYNIVLNLSSMAEDDGWPEQASRLAAAREKVQVLPSFPSPWGFLTSGYMVGLMITAILLHRIQNVVIPSPRRATRYRTSFPYTTTLWERFHGFILPLDFSRTVTRLLLHLPTVCFLSKMLVIWIVLVFQTCQVPLVFGVALGRDQKGTAAYVGAIQGWLEQLARWAVDQEMTRICWSTFWAVCAAFLIEGFIKAMDGLGGGGGGLPLGGGGVNSLSPFHLVSYAFLLHVYSSPLAHGFHPADDSPSRPDKHVVITITIALLQLSMFHVLSISKRLSRHRLIPTTVASLLSLIHFHATVFYHLMEPTTTGRTTARQSANSSRISSSRYMAVGSTYPLLNYVPNLFETALLVTILLTVTVNAVAQLLVRGRVDHVLSGLGIFSGLPNDDGTNSGFFANLPYEEDFIIVLMRIGVASLEATGLRGWNNEVAPIQRPKVRPRRVQWVSASKKGRLSAEFGREEDTYGQVRMGRMGVVARVQYGTTTTSMGMGTGIVARTRAMMGWDGRDGYEELGMNRTTMTKKTKKKKTTMRTTRIRRGFDNDVRIIDLGQAGGSSSSSGLMSGSWNRSVVVVVAFWQFLVVLGGVLWGFGALVLDGMRRRVSGDSGRRGKRRSGRRGEGEGEGLEEWDVGDDWEGEGEGEDELMNEDGGLVDDEVYQRFLRGEDISDDDDEGDAMEGSSDEEMSEEEEDEEAEEGGREREGEVVDLFTDLLRNPDVEGEDCRMVGGPAVNGSSGEMALAHLLHGSVSSSSSRPLTRRVWNGLFRRRGYLDGQVDEDDDRGGRALEENHDDRYYNNNNRGVEERDREKGVEHVCVVCMLETREVICWPCRCLAMCDGCRGRLAMRTSASKHRCPCCRQIVDGYSKIYIP